MGNYGHTDVYSLDSPALRPRSRTTLTAQGLIPWLEERYVLSHEGGILRPAPPHTRRYPWELQSDLVTREVQEQRLPI